MRSDLSEKPILKADQDELQIELRIVAKIVNLLSDFSEISSESFTLAISGEWGVGKTSALNLLKNKLDKKRFIHISFDPFLSGNLEILNLIEEFYLKLYKELISSSVKEAIKKGLKSLLVLSRCKIDANMEIPGAPISVKGSYNWSDNVDELIKIWEDNPPKELSEQLDLLNKVLGRHRKKIVLTIDEIDSDLPSKNRTPILSNHTKVIRGLKS
ncbi:P-loop NTPase fold protein [Legionella sainthelensi]|uniref:KAP NTPase domain-containing protein n=1 Tax=Legionella sainthelensi TaxID=28087 RepID=A0A2H5FQK6_9GAMM|nr:P-loop NTPase fold protein [Legionella sainthelensi]AUH73824.1 hypothetical protein CAB17_18580 [Legionella sainthelensi]